MPRDTPPVATGGPATLTLVPTTEAERPTALPSFVVSITKNADGDFVIKGTGFQPNEALTVHMSRYFYWIVGAQGDETDHVAVIFPKIAPAELKLTDETIITIIGSSPYLYHIHSAGNLSHEPLTIRLGADRGPNCQVDGGPCIWHEAADANGVYDRVKDFSRVNGLGKYWISISGDTSARTGTTSFVLGSLLQ